MKFCPICESKMVKNTVTGAIQFVCRCTQVIPGGPEDTLMSEGVDSGTNLIKYQVFMENAAHDLAAYRIEEPCSQCNAPFLTMIRVGITEQVLYVCTCGFKITHEEYKKITA